MSGPRSRSRRLEPPLKVVSATVALAIIPGVLVTLFLPPRRTLSLLEAIGFGIAISFGLLHVVTTIAVSAT